MPNSPKLSALKNKKIQLQWELDSIVKVTENKQLILNELLKKLKEADKILEDDYSKKRLLLTKEHKKLKEELDIEIHRLRSTVDVLKLKESALRETNELLNQKASDIRISIIENNKIARESLAAVDSLKIESQSLRSAITQAKNNIDLLNTDKKVLQDRLATQVMENNNDLYAMKTKFNEEQINLEKQIKESRVELRKLQQTILLHNNKSIEIIEAEKAKEMNLIQRENSLVIKMNALSKEQTEFETETRRWNYIKPLPD